MNTRATGLPKTSAFYCPQPVYNPTCISDPTASVHLPHHNAHQNSREQHVVGGLDGKHKHLSHQISQNVIFLMPSVGLDVIPEPRHVFQIQQHRYTFHVAMPIRIHESSTWEVSLTANGNPRVEPSCTITGLATHLPGATDGPSVYKRSSVSSDTRPYPHPLTH